MQSEQKKADRNWSAFKNGSEDAFAEIYREHVKGLLNYGYKVTSDRRLIEDSIQDLFYELWKNRARETDRSRTNIADWRYVPFRNLS